MTWNYRIVRHEEAGKETYLALHEVYYTKAGKPDAWTSDPISFVCDEDEGPEGIRNSLAMALADAVRREVLVVRDGEIVPEKAKWGRNGR